MTDPIWEVINEYVESCGGDPSKGIYGNASRLAIVVRIEQAILAYVDDVQGRKNLDEDLNHTGGRASSLEDESNVFEKIFAEEWGGRNAPCSYCPELHSTLDYRLSDTPSMKSQSDATTAATVIQWLGSEGGQEFLVDVFVRAAVLKDSQEKVIHFFKDVLLGCRAGCRGDNRMKFIKLEGVLRRFLSELW